MIPMLDDVTGCSAGALEQASYDVTQDADRAGPLYVAASNTCYVHTLGLSLDVSDKIDGFTYVASVATSDDATTDGIDNDDDGFIDGDDPEGETDFTRVSNALTINVFEGQSINFSACGEECQVGTATTLSNFKPLDVNKADGTVWEIKGIPHCAWNPQACALLLPGVDASTEASARSDLCRDGVLRLVGNLLFAGTCTTVRKELLIVNVTPVLPPDLIAEFTNLPNGFPDLLIPPDYQPQFLLNYHFDALLFRADDSQSGAVPEIIIDTEALAPGSYGCPEENLDTPLNTSIVVRAREDVATSCSTAGSNCQPDTHQGSMITYDCENPSRSRGCCSLYPVNLQPTLHPPAQTEDGLWFVDTDGGLVDDSAAAKLLDKLHTELLVFQDLACRNVDGDPNSLAPLDGSTCNQLTQIQGNAGQKLSNALLNTRTPNDNCSGQSRNYQAYRSQVENYLAKVQSYEANFPACNDGIDNDNDGLADTDGVPEEFLPPDPKCAGNLARDAAARVQALFAHVSVLPYVLDRMLMPTIPEACPDGWSEFNDEWITTSPPASP